MGDLKEPQALMPGALVFYLNGRKIVEEYPNPASSLLSYLRKNLLMTGTKLSCGEGGCGACTVMMSRLDANRIIRHDAVNACILPLCVVHGRSVTTIEALGSVQSKLHPIQEKLIEAHGTQCGFCTPGMVMSMYALLRNNPVPSLSDIERNLDGNLCRCTGYRPIMKAFHQYGRDFNCPMGEKCCKNGVTNQEKEDPATNGEHLSNVIKPAVFDATQEPIFPPELLANQSFATDLKLFEHAEFQWYRPTTLSQCCRLLEENSNATILAGNTFNAINGSGTKMEKPNCVVYVGDIENFKTIDTAKDGIVFGAAVTLSVFENELQTAIRKYSEESTVFFREFCKVLEHFAGTQIRNVVTIAGSVATGFEKSDLNPLFIVSKTKVHLLLPDGSKKTTDYDVDFALPPGSLITSITVPFSQPGEIVKTFRQADRKTNALADINSAFCVQCDGPKTTVQDMQLVFGCVTSQPVSLTHFGLPERIWDQDLLSFSLSAINEVFKKHDISRYKTSVGLAFFFKFFVDVHQTLHLNQELPDWLCPTGLSPQQPSTGLQLYEDAPCSQSEHDMVWRSMPMYSSAQQATGEALYCDDLQQMKSEVYLAPVMSARAHAKLVNVDPSQALLLPGVTSFVSCNDVKDNSNGPGDEIFASDKVYFHGQVIGCIAAESSEIAERAAKLVAVEYEDIPAILSIEDAVKAKSFIVPPIELKSGDLEAGFAAADDVIEGEIETHGQEHMYMEPQAALAIPLEGEEMEVHISCQEVTRAQMLIANALGVKRNKVRVVVKRLGGGFGGKEVNKAAVVALPVAVAAYKLRRPVRWAMNRNDDMRITGGRHPFKAAYKIMGCAMMRSDNIYNIPVYHITGYACKTNTASNTAFRGFGGPQANFIQETWLTHVAEKLGKPVEEVQHINIYHDGDVTFLKQTLVNWNGRKCWEQLREQVDYDVRKGKIDEYNKKSRWLKRGISLVPISFGVPFAGFLPYNQGAALVHAYLDGSVLVQHGGIEMGQGLITKCLQIASRALDLPMSELHTSRVSSDTVPNATSTAGSSSTDLFGAAVMKACEELRQRIEPYRERNPSGNWADWVNAAYMDRVSLSVVGYHKTEGISNLDMSNLQPATHAAYFTVGAAVTEVEVDVLTGAHQLVQTDILMDVGTSLNPAIDIGQIEGGYIQGYGLHMMEEVKYDEAGRITTVGPNTYKIPTCRDIPMKMNVTLLKDSRNTRAVYSSKAIGEPPLILGMGAFFAARHAVKAALSDNGFKDAYFRLDSPAVPERILAACAGNKTTVLPF